MLFDTVLAFDHVQHRILIIANARITADDDLESLYQFACAKIQFLERELERNLSHRAADAGERARRARRTTRASGSKRRCATAKEHIAAGDIYQVVLSQRFEADVAADPFTVYRALRHVNPSPYMYFIRMGGVSVVGSSPEMLVRVEGSRVETHPIAGTRPRGRNEEEDLRLAEELKRNEKERAEHVMLVDLGRNDVGRVCEYGIGARAAVHGARALLARDAPDVDRRRAGWPTIAIGSTRWCRAFPAGTVSGAPKVRAMQIIRELEPSARGLYAGAVGYLDFAGNLDFCIAIRTVIMSGGKAYVQAGAGIVIDSNPTAEYEETRDKARALLRALELAQQGLVRRWRACNDLSSSITTIRSPTTSCSTWASWAPRCSVVRNDAATVDEVAALRARAHRHLAGPGRPEDAGITMDVDPRAGRDDADPRRVPRASGDRRGVRRVGRARAGADARQDVDDRARRPRRVHAASPSRSSPRGITRWSSRTRGCRPSSR